MCCLSTKKDTEKLKKNWPRWTKRRFWKVLDFNGCTAIRSKKTHPGVNHLRGRRVEKYHRKSPRGVHVYTSEYEAMKRLLPWRDDMLMPVWCYREDLIAADEFGEAVFQKVTINKKDWDRRFGKGNP